jgi:threonine dehydratase
MTSSTLRELHLDDFKKTYSSISDFLTKTPLRRFEFLEKHLGLKQRVFLKCENEQKTNSFKIRAAYGALNSLTEEEKQKGVISRSSGNFAQALAYACKSQNIPCTVVVPTTCPTYKMEKAKQFTSQLLVRGKSHKEGLAYVNKLAKEHQLTVLAPYNHYGVILGNGSIAFEILEDCPEVSAVFTPVGGGGLSAGLSSVMKQTKSDCLIFAVEPEDANDFEISLREKKHSSKNGLSTIADGLRAPCVGEKEWPILLKNIDYSLSVSEESIVLAMQILYKKLGIKTEPSGATALAGLISAAKQKLLPSGDLVVTISGGNIDETKFLSLM